jgi:hypothetical protein
MLKPHVGRALSAVGAILARVTAIRPRTRWVLVVRTPGGLVDTGRRAAPAMGSPARRAPSYRPGTPAHASRAGFRTTRHGSTDCRAH